MDNNNTNKILELAHADLLRADYGRAKDRLRAVLRASPHCIPALDMMGQIYYVHGDHRNAMMYWSRAGRWEENMRECCDRVFSATRKALARENAQAVRYHLYAFAGSTPPQDIADELVSLQQAYFKLDEKRSRLMALSCVPAAGGTMLAALAMLSVLLGGGWSSLMWIGIFSISATVVVLGVNTWLYYRASRLFKETVFTIKPPQSAE